MKLDKLYNVINNGGLAVVPTDTIYGIIADATNNMAIMNVYDIKQRDYSKPLIILVSNYEMLENYVKDINELEKEIIKSFWPGELTILLKKKDTVSDLITNCSQLVGVRIPKSNMLIELINKLGRPVISTSANISKKESITNIDMLESSIKNKVDFILDVGEMNNKASTIIQVIDNKIKIIRVGDLFERINNSYEIIK